MSHGGEKIKTFKLTWNKYIDFLVFLLKARKQFITNIRTVFSTEYFKISKIIF